MNFYLMFLGSILIVAAVLVRIFKPGLRVRISLCPLKVEFFVSPSKKVGANDVEEEAKHG